MEAHEVYMCEDDVFYNLETIAHKGVRCVAFLDVQIKGLVQVCTM